MKQIDVLVTGFEPFDQEPQNCTAMILQSLPQFEGVESVVLPVSFSRSWMTLESLLRRFRPKVVLALGQAETRQAFSFEQVALNWMAARIPDNDGAKPLGEAVSEGAPLALWSSLPNWRLLERVRAQQAPGEISFHAGTYVCNALMYHLLNWAEKNGARAGFLHVPLLKEQLETSALTLKTAVDAASAVIQELLVQPITADGERVC